jgi:hypothetical protein
MAEPYFPGGPRPQSLGKTLEDLQRFGKGLLVGETADILGLPADLTGLYYDVRYGQTPQGIQSLIDRFGSEALAKRFMGKDFPEFSFENFGQDTEGGIESAGRAFAPGALLTKAIATARLAARMNKYPPDNGGGGYALATVGTGKLNPLDDVPETTAERLYMTQGLPGGGQAKKREEPFFDELTPDPDARLTPTGSVFSNLLNELSKIGDESSRLSMRKPIMRPELDKDGKVVKDNRGKAIVKDTGEFQIKGIDFTKEPTGAELLAYFENKLTGDIGKKFGGEGLKDAGGSGLQSRLGKEAVESGLIRYLELNPDEIMTKEKVINLASLFKPEIKMTSYSVNRQAELGGLIRDFETRVRGLADDDPVRVSLTNQLAPLLDEIEEYNRHNPWSFTNVQNLKIQDLDRPGGRLSERNQDMVRNDSLTFLFSGGEGENLLLGKKADSSSANEIDKMIAEVDDYFRAMGETTSLKTLLPGSRHGFGIDNYQGHIRATGMDTIDPATGRKYKTLSINEIQSNQAGEKGKTVAAQDPKITSEIKRLLDKRAKLNSEGKSMSDAELEQLSRLVAASGRLTRFENFNTFLSDIDDGIPLEDFKPPNVMTNKNRMDALQIVKEDKKLGTGFVNLAEEKAILQKQADDAAIIADKARDELAGLTNSVTDMKRAFFATDQRLNRDKLLLNDFKKAKEQIIEDIMDMDSGVSGATVIDRDAGIPRYLASMFYKSSRDSTTSAHLPNGRGLDNVEIGRIVGSRSSDFENQADFLEDIRKKSKAKYGTQGDVDILSEVLSDKNTELARDFKLFKFPNANPDDGRDVIITDIDMMRDYYTDLMKARDEGTFGTIGSEAERGLYGRIKKDRVTYKDYIQLKKIANGADYFKDKDNARKTLRYLMNDRERKLEAGLIKTEIFNKVMNNPKVTEIFESDNLIELKDRLADLDKNQASMDDIAYGTERRKILDDIKTDFGLTEVGSGDTAFFNLEMLKGRSPIADAFAKAADEVYDEYSKTLKKVPVLTDAFYNRLQPRRPKTTGSSELDNAFGAAFSNFFKEPKLWDVKEFNKKLTDKKRKTETINSAFDDYVQENFVDSSTLIESAIAKRGLEQFKKDKDFVEKRVAAAEVNEQDTINQLADFNREKDFDKLLEDLKDRLPEELKDTLQKIIEHEKTVLQGGNKFQMNVPVLDYGQMTELMVHNVIKKAKELGYERVVFPSMEAYDDMAQREFLPNGVTQRREYGDLRDTKAYDFAIGKPLTDALKKYGKGYITANEVIASKAQGRTGTARVGKKQERSNAIDDDLHRIVDLTIEEASKKADSNIPRMAKGGILSKFRKAS